MQFSLVKRIYKKTDLQVVARRTLEILEQVL